MTITMTIAYNYDYCLITVHYSLITDHYSLFTIHCSLFTVHLLPFAYSRIIKRMSKIPE